MRLINLMVNKEDSVLEKAHMTSSSYLESKIILQEWLY